MEKSSKIYVKCANDVPRIPHYAIIESTTIYIPGDERSRTHPGHGYPEEHRQMVNYIAFTNRAEWEAEVSRRAVDRLGGRPDFIAVQVNSAKVITQVVINTP